MAGRRSGTGGRVGAADRGRVRGGARYFAGDFAAALATFMALPYDPPSRVLAARRSAYLAAPPAVDWNGVHAARSK